MSFERLKLILAALISRTSRKKLVLVLAVLILSTIVFFGSICLICVWLAQYYAEHKILVPLLTIILAATFGKWLLDLYLKIVSDCFVIIPTAHFAIVRRLEERTGEVLTEGLNAKLPLIETADELVPDKLFKLPVMVTFPSKDERWLICNGSVEYRLDPRVRRNGLSVCVEISREVIEDGIINAIKKKLSALGQLYSAKAFRENQLAVTDFIECYLRLKIQPQKQQPLGKRSVLASGLLGFLKRHRDETKKSLDEEKNHSRDRSEVEKRYGIDVVVYVLSGIDYTKETRDAMDEITRAEEKLKAGEQEIEYIRQLRKEDVSGQIAVNAAKGRFRLNTVKETVLSIEGIGNNPVLINVPDLSGRGGHQPETEKFRRKDGE